MKKQTTKAKLYSSGTQAGYNFAQGKHATQADVDGYSGSSTSFKNGMQQYVDEQTAADGTSLVKTAMVQNEGGQISLDDYKQGIWNKFNNGEVQMVQAKSMLANPDLVSPDADYQAAQVEVNKQIVLNKQNSDEVIARLKSDTNT